VLRIVVQQITIVLHARSAAGSVANHDSNFPPLECVNGPRPEIKPCLLFSSVDHERTATALIPGDDHFATFRSQYAGSGGVDLGEEDSLHASEQQTHTQARFALCCHALRERGSVGLIFLWS